MVFNLKNYIKKNFKYLSTNYQKIINDNYILYKAFFIACFLEKNQNILPLKKNLNQIRILIFSLIFIYKFKNTK